MFKKFFLTSSLFISFICAIYPTNKENTKPLDYCYSLEKIISRNSINKRKYLKGPFKSISSEIAKFGVNKTRGLLINKMINEYKTSKDSFILYLFPNKIYCLGGYWIEEINPGKFESILVDKSKKVMKDLQDLKDLTDLKDLQDLKDLTDLKDLQDLKEEVDLLIKDFNSDYETIRNELINAF